MTVPERVPVRVIEAMDLVRATELVSAAFEEAMDDYGLLKSTRDQIGFTARLKVMQALADDLPDIPDRPSMGGGDHAHARD